MNKSYDIISLLKILLNEGDYLSREEKNKIDYMVVCVNEFAERFIMNYKDAFNYLFKYKAIRFLNENYVIEHTLSIEDAIEDIILIAKNNGGNLI